MVLTPHLAGTVIVRGKSQVEGTTTTLESRNTVITDNVIVLNNGETNAGISTPNHSARSWNTD